MTVPGPAVRRGAGVSVAAEFSYALPAPHRISVRNHVSAEAAEAAPFFSPAAISAVSSVRTMKSAEAASGKSYPSGNFATYCCGCGIRACTTSTSSRRRISAAPSPPRSMGWSSASPSSGTAPAMRAWRRCACWRGWSRYICPISNTCAQGVRRGIPPQCPARA